MQGNLWPGATSGGGGGSAAGCVLGPDPSSCMSPYPHPHSNLQGFMGMPTSSSHPHHHHPPHHHHHPGINGLYSLHGFPGGLGSPSIDGPETDYKPTGLVALRMKAKEPGSILSWPTWPQQCQLSIMHWLSQSILHYWSIHSPKCKHAARPMTQIFPLNIYISQIEDISQFRRPWTRTVNKLRATWASCTKNHSYNNSRQLVSRFDIMSLKTKGGEII